MPISKKTKEFIRMCLKSGMTGIETAKKAGVSPNTVYKIKAAMEEKKNCDKLKYHTEEYRKWRLACLIRDGFKCRWCGSKYKLQVDHIKSWSQFPELRYEVSNGRTLCLVCHKKTPTWGSKSLKYKNTKL